jgi:AmiR/NasT family two-component response regulator
MAAADVAVGQALADLAAIGIINQRNAMRSRALTQQLQTALTSRTAIEQAKGMLAERGHINPDQAFDLLRRYARANNARLTEIAHSVIAGADTSAILHPN